MQPQEDHYSDFTIWKSNGSNYILGGRVRVAGFQHATEALVQEFAQHPGTYIVEHVLSGDKRIVTVKPIQRVEWSFA